MALAAEAAKSGAHSRHFSVFTSQAVDAPVYDVPMRALNRPFPPILDEGKVERFMDDMRNGDDLTPIEVLRCQAPNDERVFFFSFGGCHRYEAAKRLGLETIKGKIINVRHVAALSSSPPRTS